jgi:hypothetical protein
MRADICRTFRRAEGVMIFTAAGEESSNMINSEGEFVEGKSA